MNILVTGASSYGLDNRPYYQGLNVLVESVNRYDKENIIDKIVIVDFGLNKEHKDNLIKNSKVEFMELPKTIFDYFNKDNIGRFKYYCYRSYIMSEIFFYWKNSFNLLWLDAGVCFIDNPKEIFDIIENENIFVVEHDDCYTGDAIPMNALKVLFPREKELRSTICFGGICGYKKDSIYELIFKQIFNYSLNLELIKSFHDYKDGRYQAILSVLIDRYGIKKQNHRKFADHLGIKTRPDQVLFVHRCYTHNWIQDYWRKHGE